MRRLYTLLPLLLLNAMVVTAQEFDTIRICTYKLDSFGADPGIDSAVSTAHLAEIRLILEAIGPDILFVQGIDGLEAHDLLDSAITSTLSTPLATVRNLHYLQHERLVGIFYDPERFIIEWPALYTGTQNGNLSGRLLLRGPHSGQTFTFICSDLHDGETDSSEALRYDEAWWLSSLLHQHPGTPSGSPPTEERLFAGSLNTSTSREAAYLRLTSPDSGIVADPVGRPGDWSGNPAFADLHSSSTRIRPLRGESGLSDRADFILLSPALLQHYVPGSYTTFGNDGAHFGDSINEQPNLAVSPAMADALHDASDHLPVFLDLVFERVVSDVPRTTSPFILDLADRTNE